MIQTRGVRTGGYLLGVLGLCGLFVYWGAAFIRHSAPTYDEGVHVSAGYSYWKTSSVKLNAKDHPPLVKKLCAIPLLGMGLSFPRGHPSYAKNLQWDVADIFVYWNTRPAERIINAGRFVNLGLGLALCLLVWHWSARWFGWGAGLWSLLLAVTSPTFIANSSLITTDTGLAFGWTAAIYLLWRYFEKPAVTTAGLAGAAVGICMCSKYSGFLILGVYACVCAFCYVRGTYRVPGVAALRDAAVCVVGCLCIAVFCYGFENLGQYLLGIETTFQRMDSGRSSFLCGEYSITGWRHYFLVAFLIKNPIPFLITLGLTAFFFVRPGRSKVLASRREWVFLLFPALLFFAVASFSTVQIGHRHILPVYPLLIIWAGGLLPRMCGSVAWVGKSALALISVWLLAVAAGTTPLFLSYFNSFVGGSAGGYRCMVDSNLDWGQSLKSLARYLKGEGIGAIYFSYFGSADPHYYGITYIPVGFVSTLTRSGDPVDISQQRRTVFAVSVTNLQATYYSDKHTFGFFRTRTPTKIIDHTIWVYDITHDAAANEYLRGLFIEGGNTPLVAAQDAILARIAAEGGTPR